MQFLNRQPPEDAGQSRVPQTISAKKWDRMRDSLPFPVDPSALTSSEDIRRRVSFGHQRMRAGQS